MKDRLLLIAILLIGAAAFYLGFSRPHVSTIPRRVRAQLPEIKPPMPALPDLALPPLEMPALLPPTLPDLAPPMLPLLPPPEKK